MPLVMSLELSGMKHPSGCIDDATFDQHHAVCLSSTRSPCLPVEQRHCCWQQQKAPSLQQQLLLPVPGTEWVCQKQISRMLCADQGLMHTSFVSNTHHPNAPAASAWYAAQQACTKSSAVLQHEDHF